MGYEDLSERFHRPICDFLEYNPSRYKLVMQARGTFKTSLNTISRNARDALKYPNRRFAILNEIADRAQAWLVTIRTLYESNPIVRTLFSDVLPKDARSTPYWSSKALQLVRQVDVPEPTIAAYGIETSLTGWHHTDWTIDDPISEKAREEESTMQKAIERVSKITSLMVDPKSDRQTFVGTPWTKHDVIAHFVKSYKKKLAVYWMPAVLNDQLTFPERVDWDVLDEARRLQGELQLSAQYFLKPRDVTTEDFKVSDIRYYRIRKDGAVIDLLDDDGFCIRSILVSNLDITMTVDPAMSEKKKSDRNAIVVVGTTLDGIVIVLDTWAERVTPIAVVEKIHELYWKWAPRIVAIESVAYQGSLKYWVGAKQEATGVWYPIRDMPRSKNKHITIRGLQPIAASGRLYIAHHMSTLREEMLDFPDPSVHDDVLDALSMHLKLFNGVLDEENEAREEAKLKSLLKRIDGYNLKPESRIHFEDDEADDEAFDFPEYTIQR